MNSEAWLMPTCFSPLTSRLPLANTSITVTVMVPVNTLLLAVSPSPLNLKSVVADRPAPMKLLPGRPVTLGTDRLLSLERLVVVLDFLSADVFSTMLTISVSPILRARRSSNSGLFV